MKLAKVPHYIVNGREFKDYVLAGAYAESTNSEITTFVKDMYESFDGRYHPDPQSLKIHEEKMEDAYADSDYDPDYEPEYDSYDDGYEDEY